jgi:hypothetical protein
MATFDDNLVTNPAGLSDFVIAKFTAERELIAGSSCGVCAAGCDCTQEQGPGCGHYACLGRLDFMNETCPVAIRAAATPWPGSPSVNRAAAADEAGVPPEEAWQPVDADMEGRAR